MTISGTSEGSARTAARSLVAEGRFEEAWRLARSSLLAQPTPTALAVAGNVLRAGRKAGFIPAGSRRARLAILCSYEAASLVEALEVACAALSIEAELHLAPYGQLEQELLVDHGPLAEFAPTHVLIAPSTADLGLPELADEQDAPELVRTAAGRWQRLWELVRERHGATVLQHTFVVPELTPLGHMSMRLAGSRVSMIRELNRQLGESAGSSVLLVDCERLAADAGKRSWQDPRLWFGARQPWGGDAIGMLALQTAALLAADLGLAARCLVVDLDNTLWGGVVGEDGIDGIEIGEGPAGEAYAAFQDYVRALGERGVVLAVASKNDRESAEEPFRAHRGMRLSLDDFAVFLADWRPKSEQVSEIAATLGIGLETIVFADDNAAECAQVAAALPDVTTVRLDVPPSERVRRLASTVRFELASLSREDVVRHRSYVGRARATQLREQATSLEEFWRSLQMHARVRAVEEGSLDRAAQLTRKTNQFNLTLRRHTREEIERIVAQPRGICRTLELADRFADHGIVGLGFVVQSDEDDATALIDTLLLSCRVIGRTAEVHLLAHLSAAAIDRGFTRMRGVYVQGPRNAFVADVYGRLGFVACEGQTGVWDYDLAAGPLVSSFIEDDR